MAQGFKSKPPSSKKASSSTSTKKKLAPKDLKKGRLSIPPKKAQLVERDIIHKKHTAAHSSNLEKVIATQAVSHGKLTIMRSTADESEEGKKAARYGKK